MSKICLPVRVALYPLTIDPFKECLNSHRPPGMYNNIYKNNNELDVEFPYTLVRRTACQALLSTYIIYCKPSPKPSIYLQHLDPRKLSTPSALASNKSIKELSNKLSNK